MNKFTQPVSMVVTQEQYERDLKGPLAAMGYEEESSLGNFQTCPFLVTNSHKRNGLLNNYSAPSSETSYVRHFIDCYNPKLFLALAAMTESDTPTIGEYWHWKGAYPERFMCCEPKTNFRNTYNFGKGKDSCHIDYLTKAAKEELIEHFMNREKLEESRFPFKLATDKAKCIIDLACIKWKSTLSEKWGKDTLLHGYVMIDEPFYREMRSACNTIQHQVFDDIFGKDDPVWTIRDAKDGEPVWCKDRFGSCWLLRYADGRGFVYSSQRKYGDQKSYDWYRKFDPNDLPVSE